MSPSRRRFHTLALGGLAGLSVAPLRQALAKPKPFALTFGVQSYSFRDLSLDEAIAAMAKLGLSTCELWQGHIEPRFPLVPRGTELPEPEKTMRREAARKWRLEAPLREVEAVAAKFKKAGVGLCAFNYSFRNDYTDQEIARGFQFAKALGVKAITASSNQQTVARIAPLAKKHEIVVAMHNHAKLEPDEFARPEDFEKAMTGPGREYIGVNLDIGHFAAANFDSVAFLKKHHAKIVTLHIKDRKRDQGPAVPFGQGDAPIKDVLKLLRDERWAIPANIEYEYPGASSVDEVARCLDYCRKALVA